MGLTLLNRQTIELAGLDIGSAAVKFIRLNQTDHGYALVSAVAEPIEQCEGDEDVRRQNTLAAIQSCLQQANWKNKSVVCGISGPEVVVRGFTFPPLPEAAIEQAVRMEAQQVCPMDINQSTLDFQLIETPTVEASKKSSKVQPRHGVMAVASDCAIQQRTSLLTDAGTKALMVDVDSLAMLNCLNELQLIEPQETVAVIDIGSHLTNVVIYGCDGLPFVRNIDKAASAVIRDISKDLEMSENDVWQSFTQDSATDQLLLSLNNAIVPLVNAINETLRFYSFQEKQTGADRIFLCGGFSLIDPFVEFLSDALSVPVEKLNPFEKITCDKSDKQQQALVKNGPVYAIATGLAMRTLP